MDNSSLKLEKIKYDNGIVRAFLYATIFWGVFAFLAGLLVAVLLFWPQLPEFFLGSDDGGVTSLGGDNVKKIIDLQGATGLGRWRMIHTTFAIFAFVGNGIFLGIYYSLQRLLKTRMYSDVLSWVNFWGWQLFIVLSFVTFILGINTTKEYAEHEWPIDILVAFVWILFGVNMFMTIYKRRVRHLYVAIWFYIATWVGITVLHVFNNLALPLSFTKSYSVYAGVQDALVQWWYGHNAVAFFLTTPVLGLMYYYIPKAANRPVFSYKLSIIHFWSLIFVYIWAGPHHLLYTALPAWVQALGTAFSLMLIAPSWGGMLNGLLTLRGAWDKVREQPVLKFLVVAVTCYGMATFEGPMLATKTLNKIGHFTNWVIAHVHVGTLGWNGFMAFGVIYWLVPKLWNTKIYSKKLANAHFWIGTMGILFYVVPMYISGFTQGLIWQAFNGDGSLTTSNWLESIGYDTGDALPSFLKFLGFYPLRALGGSLYLTGALLMVYNVFKTVRAGHFVKDEEAEVPALVRAGVGRRKGEKLHPWLERMPLVLTILSTIVLAIGGLVEIVPTLAVKSNIPEIASVKPYTPLELEGRDIYIREACNACHTQVVRPFRDEIVRFGEYARPGEYVYDHPFLWGSKRTGPDLLREGGKNPDSWHYKHFWNPRSTSAGSIMPRYPWVVHNELDKSQTEDKMELMVNLGVPYSDIDIDGAQESMLAQAKEIESRIFDEAQDVRESYREQELVYKKEGKDFVPLHQREVVALISYLQRLGTDIKVEETETVTR